MTQFYVNFTEQSGRNFQPKNFAFARIFKFKFESPI